MAKNALRLNVLALAETIWTYPDVPSFLVGVLNAAFSRSSVVAETGLPEPVTPDRGNARVGNK